MLRACNVTLKTNASLPPWFANMRSAKAMRIIIDVLAVAGIMALPIVLNYIAHGIS